MNEPHLIELAALITERHRAAHATAAQAVELARQAGELLIQAKAQLPHGAWAGWLADHCQIKDRTARDYMRLARELPRLDPAKRRRVADLPIRQALKTLATPKAHATGHDPIFSKPKDHMQSLAPWYDLVMEITLVLFADGLDAGDITDRTGFGPYEVGRILSPEKPIRFNGPTERHLISHEQQALYAAWVDWKIARSMSFQYSEYGAQGMAQREGMAHTLPTLNALERQWRALESRSRTLMDSIGGELPDNAWYVCALTDSRIAIGLDRELAGHDLPALLALMARPSAALQGMT